MSSNRTVICKMECAVISDTEAIPITCAMIYQEDVPFEVIFTTHERTEDGEPCEWHYARDLLVDALRGKDDVVYGSGDVKTSCKNQFIYTLLTQGDHQVMLAFMKSDLQTFISATEEIVPVGLESINLGDNDLERFLTEE